MLSGTTEDFVDSHDEGFEADFAVFALLENHVVRDPVIVQINTAVGDDVACGAP